jgi:predicted ester cyclase
MTIAANKACIRQYIEQVWGQANDTADQGLLAPDYVDHTPPPGIAPDRAGHRENLRIFRTAFPDAQFSIDDLIGEGDTVVARWAMHATQQGPFYRIPTTNRRCTLTGIDIYRLVGGRIREVWHEQDVLGMLRQLSLIHLPFTGEHHGMEQR